MKKRKEIIVIRVNEETKSKLQEVVDKKDETMSGFMNRLILKYLKENNNIF